MNIERKNKQNQFLSLLKNVNLKAGKVMLIAYFKGLIFTVSLIFSATMILGQENDFTKR